MDNNGNLLDNDSDKARLLNNYFASVFVKDNGLMSEFEPLDYDFSNKINVVYFSPEKVIKAIKKLKTNGSGGDDKLPNIFFFNVAPEIAFSLTIIKNDLVSHLYSNKLISKHQHRFLSKHSTSTQLLECANDWAIQISKKNQVDIAYLDFCQSV